MVKINTGKLQNLVTRAAKGVGNNRMLPITSLMQITCTENGLELATTDATNYLYVRDTVEQSDDLVATVNADLFIKLISKSTTEFVTLNVKDGTLEVTSNGKYVLPMQLTESRKIVTFPDPCGGEEVELVQTIQLDSVRSAITVCKDALSNSVAMPIYTNYFVGDSIIATDTIKINQIKEDIFGDNPYLISGELLDLVGVLTNEEIKVYQTTNGSHILFMDSNGTVIGPQIKDLSTFRIEIIKQLLNTPLDYRVVFNKTELIAVLDRISLFVGDYDDRKIKLLFSDSGLTIASLKHTGDEHIEYANEKIDTKPAEFTCEIDVSLFLEQLKCFPDKVVVIEYGNDKFIKLTGEGVAELVALD